MAMRAVVQMSRALAVEANFIRDKVLAVAALKAGASADERYWNKQRNAAIKEVEDRDDEVDVQRRASLYKDPRLRITEVPELSHAQKAAKLRALEVETARAAKERHRAERPFKRARAETKKKRVVKKLKRARNPHLKSPPHNRTHPHSSDDFDRKSSDGSDGSDE